MNQSTHRQNGRILLIALAYAAFATSLTPPVALAQSSTGPQSTLGSGVTPGDAEAIEAVIDAMPLSSARVLDALSDATRAEVERICLPVQYQSGALAYRECINEQIDAQPTTPRAIVPITSLSFDEEYAIQQTCRDAGPVDSAAYLTCDEAQLASLAGVPEPALDRVSEDDTYAVQLGCYESQTNAGVKAYRECLNESISQLLALPRPDLFALTLVERNALQLRCSAQNTNAVGYRNCLLDAVNDATVADGAVDTPAIQNDVEPSSELSSEPFSESSEQIAPRPDGTAAAELDASSVEVPALAVTDSDTTAVTTPVVEVEQTVTTQAIRLPTTGNLNQRDTTENSNALSDTPEETEDSAQPPTDLLTRLRTTVTSMNDMTRMLMWTAIGMPILLTLFWLLIRARKPAPVFEAHYPERPIDNGVDTAPHRPSSTLPKRTTDDDTANLAHWDPASGQHGSSALPSDDALNFTAQMDELFGKSASEVATTANEDTSSDISRNLDTTPGVSPTAPLSRKTRQTPKIVSDQILASTPASILTTAKPELAPDFSSGSDADSGPANTAASESPAVTDFTLAPATQRDDYLAWLSVQDETKQQTLAIEFLIYWMAYSDERYSPELKKKIFQLQNPGDHELIKRWTLKQNVHAFAGNLQWLQYNLSTVQHEQIISLLLALLVSENALTPAQNTLLRFLADAFGLGAQRLDALFQTGFAHPMPPLPELDNPDWWKRQSADSLKRWDARSVSRQRSEIRYRVALGLPLREELDPESIMASFRRASRRCQPERFNRLSLREQKLVAKQLEKYETAADSLLEVSA